jgi:hypothetical protein
MRPDYFLGLDLGQTRDFTALAVLERSPPADAGAAVEKPEYALRHLHRFPLGTPYTQIVPAVAALVRAGPLAESPVVVDQTGVGRAVVDMLRLLHPNRRPTVMPKVWAFVNALRSEMRRFEKRAWEPK